MSSGWGLDLRVINFYFSERRIFFATRIEPQRTRATTRSRAHSAPDSPPCKQRRDNTLIQLARNKSLPMAATELLDVAAGGNKDRCQLLLSQGADANISDKVSEVGYHTSRKTLWPWCRPLYFYSLHFQFYSIPYFCIDPLSFSFDCCYFVFVVMFHFHCFHSSLRLGLFLNLFLLQFHFILFACLSDRMDLLPFIGLQKKVI